MRKKGFTLIELLVVIAIIALLLSIIVPSLKRAKEVASSKVCLSYVKQWGLIVKMYTDDNHGWFWRDPGETTEEQIGPERLWMNRLEALYGENDDFRICPSAKRENEYGKAHPTANVFGKTDTIWRCGDTNIGGTTKKYVGSYGINHWLNTVPSTGPWPGGYRAKPDVQWCKAEQQNASKIPVVLDCCWYGGNPETDPWESGAKVPDEPDWLYNLMERGQSCAYFDIARFCLNRHNRAINGVFLDWSANPVPLPELWQLKWHKKSRPYYDITISWLK